MPNIIPTQEKYEELYAKVKMRWATLKRIVDSYNSHKKAYLDTHHARSEKETLFFKKHMMIYATSLLFLRVTVHHDKYGNAFLDRNECSHLLYSQHAEAILDKMNSLLSSIDSIEERRAIQEEKILSTNKTKKIQKEIDTLASALENIGYPAFLASGGGYKFVGETGEEWLYDILNFLKEQ